MNYHVVVAKYREEMNWVGGLWLPTFIYDRDPSVPIPHNPYITQFILENNWEGREADTYLRYIIDFYHDLPDVVFFLQGFPFHHYPPIYRALSKVYLETTGLSLYDPWNPLAHAPEDKITFDPKSPVFTMLGTKPITCKGSPVFTYKWPLISRWERLFPGYQPPRRLVFSAGAQMAVPRHRILQKPLSYYESIFHDIQPDSLEQDGWTMELFWLYIFGEVNPLKFPGTMSQLTAKVWS